MRWLLKALAAVLCSASLGSTSPTHSEHQLPFLADDNANVLPSNSTRVYGNNNATYGPVPREEQLFQVEFLEIAPSPFEVDRVVFAWLRGYIGHSPIPITDSDLAQATLSVTDSAIYPDGRSDEPETHTVPLQTTAYNEMTHLTIRDSEGAHADHLTIGGDNDVLVDMMILGMFVCTKTLTVEIAAELADGRTLFAFTLTQFLKGGMRDC